MTGCDPAVVLRSGSAMDRFDRLSVWRDFSGAGALVCAWGLSVWALRGGGGFPGFAAVAFLIAGFSLLVPRVAVVCCGMLHGFVLGNDPKASPRFFYREAGFRSRKQAAGSFEGDGMVPKELA